MWGDLRSCCLVPCPVIKLRILILEGTAHVNPLQAISGQKPLWQDAAGLADNRMSTSYLTGPEIKQPCPIQWLFERYESCYKSKSFHNSSITYIFNCAVHWTMLWCQLILQMFQASQILQLFCMLCSDLWIYSCSAISRLLWQEFLWMTCGLHSPQIQLLLCSSWVYRNWCVPHSNTTGQSLAWEKNHGDLPWAWESWRCTTKSLKEGFLNMHRL